MNWMVNQTILPGLKANQPHEQLEDFITGTISRSANILHHGPLVHKPKMRNKISKVRMAGQAYYAPEQINQAKGRPKKITDIGARVMGNQLLVAALQFENFSADSFQNRTRFNRNSLLKKHLLKLFNQTFQFRKGEQVSWVTFFQSRRFDLYLTNIHVRRF